MAPGPTIQDFSTGASSGKGAHKQDLFHRYTVNLTSVRGGTIFWPRMFQTSDSALRNIDFVASCHLPLVPVIV